MAVLPRRICDWPTRGAVVCGQEVAEPTHFTVQDATYEMDLCGQHEEAFYQLFEKAVAIARPVSVRRVSGTRKIMKARNGAYTTKDVRAWLKTQPGYEDISDTGRIAQELIDMYAAAHS